MGVETAALRWTIFADPALDAPAEPQFTEDHRPELAVAAGGAAGRG